MKIAVWDTYVKRKDGLVMHFDILVPDSMDDSEKVVAFGRHYLASKSFETSVLTTKACRFCHIEKATDQMMKSIEAKGYDIIEMEHCH